MITLRLHRTRSQSYETYLHLFPGTFYVLETVDRHEGVGKTTVYLQNWMDFQVFESSVEIEEKIRAQKEQP